MAVADKRSQKDSIVGTPAPLGRVVKDFLSKKAIEIVLGGILIVTAGIFAASWKLTGSYIDGYILSALEQNPKALRKIVSAATIEDLSAQDGKLLDAFRAVLAKIRQTESGTISAGRFTLAADENYVLYVYFPEGHRGKITYQIQGDIIPNKRFILLQAPNGVPTPILNLHGTIDIPTHIKANTSGDVPIAAAEEMSPFLRDLRGFTFQLVDRTQSASFDTADKPKSSSAGGRTEHLKVDVSYMAYVTPIIEIK
jgi:hypothetical protein